ncbi:MAG: YycC family protein [Bacilli bacterium]|jgi:hypothetical protein|nr:YycC family protein [Bacilli bacterium]
MRPLPISAETAIKLAEQLNIPIENLMHMPQHILLQKLAELAKNEPVNNSDPNINKETQASTTEPKK